MVLAFATLLLLGVAYADYFSPQLYVPVNSSLQQSASSTTPHTITVTGTGVATLSPDSAQVNVGVTTQGFTAKSAANQSARIVNNIINQLQSIGINRSSIVTVSYYIYPNYNYNDYNIPTSQSSTPSITSYSATYELQVTIQSSNSTQLGSRAAQVIDTATGAGANQVSGVQFTASGQLLTQLRNQAIQLAIQDASSRANTMANALAVKIVGVQSAIESPQYQYPIYYGATPALASAKTQILPGNYTSTDSVTVTYLIQ